MAKAWLFQRTKGSGNPWSVGWYKPDGRRTAKQFAKKGHAEEFRRAKENELAKALSGTADRTWSEFRDEYESQLLSQQKPGTVDLYQNAFEHFERICKPARVSKITERDIDLFKSKRLKERGKKPGTTASPATVNKELRAIKRILKVAKRWRYLPEVPYIEFLREPKVAPTFISPEEFSKLYDACDAPNKPSIPNVDNADWWRALLLFCYMTGWRISEPLHLRREDVDLEAGVAITRAGDNKGGKEFKVDLHPIVVDHLRQIQGFSLEMFPWTHTEKALWPEFRKIQDKAGVSKVCRKDHEHSESCRYYGFHDLRRGFATQNANRLGALDLQRMMRHTSFETTKRYVNMAQQASVVAQLAVPTLKAPARGNIVETDSPRKAK